MDLGAFSRRLLAFLGLLRGWFETARKNCFRLETSALPKRARLENLSFIYYQIM
jgi:hypothetical protein